MSINENRAYQLKKTVQQFSASGLVGTLGEQTMQLDGFDKAVSFFHNLGFDDMESIDISEFEGCTHIFDLNSKMPPQHLRERFDFLFNGGTVEHVFHIPNALRNVFHMLKPGGVVTHGGPINGWVDHGFYQFSPTLFLDYYFANGFEILEADIVEDQEGESGLWKILPYYPGALDGIGTTKTGGVRWNIYFTAKKTQGATFDVIPQQSHYSRIYGDPAKVATAPKLAKYEPYWLKEGVVTSPPRSRWWKR